MCAFDLFFAISFRNEVYPERSHDDVIRWKHFPRYWPFVRGIHRSPMNSPHKGQWRGALIFSLICAWTSGLVNNRDAGDLKRHRAHYCPACRTSLIATRFWVVVICPIIKCLIVFEFSFILFDLCLFITIFNFILNFVPIITFWIFTYHKIWILLIIFCFIWNYWIIYFFNMFGSVLECCELTGVSLLWPWLIKWK